MEKLPPLTQTQADMIEKVLAPAYDKTIKATSIIKLLKSYARQLEDDTSCGLSSVELEYLIDELLSLLDPVQTILSEGSCGAWYLLDSRALAESKTKEVYDG